MHPELTERWTQDLGPIERPQLALQQAGPLTGLPLTDETAIHHLYVLSRPGELLYPSANAFADEIVADSKQVMDKPTPP
jgi:hypothetical protein